MSTDRLELRGRALGIGRALLLLSLLWVCGSGWARTVGVWKVAPKYVPDTLVRTLEEAGWRVVLVGTSNLVDGAVLEGLDVLMLPGGWEPYKYAGFKARRNLVRFVAGGKGLMDCDILTSRSLFPQVGTTVRNTITGSRLAGTGKNDLANTLGVGRNGEIFELSTNSVLRAVQVGPEGEAFAVVDTTPVGLLGKTYGGRYILFGGAILGLDYQGRGTVVLTETENKALMEKALQQDPVAEDSTVQDILLDGTGKMAPGKKGRTDLRKSEKVKSATPTSAQRLLLDCLDWVASAPAPGPVEKARLQAQADLDFLRREKVFDWIKGDYWTTIIGKEESLVPDVRSQLAAPLEKRLYSLSCLAESLSGANLSRCQSLTNELHQTLGELAEGFRKVLADTEKRIGQMDAAQLLAENPSEDSIAEQMIPRARLRELTERCDKARVEFQGVIDAALPGITGTVEERMRTDPLMMPYYTGNILPRPQKAAYRDEFLPMGKVAIIVGKDVQHPAALAEILQDRLTRYGGVGVVMDKPGPDTTAILSLGDTEWARKAGELPGIPDRPEGYILHTTTVDGKPVVIMKGHDHLGLVWAIASEIQLIHWREGKTVSRAATVEDYPILQKRGMILSGEQFHSTGTASSAARTRELLQQNRLLILVAKINEPFYTHLTSASLSWKYLWKYPAKMPADARIEEDIEAMGRNLSSLGITWWGGLHPHETYESTPDYLARKVSGDAESVSALLYYARLMEKAGGHLAIILDDCRFPLSPYDQERHGTGRVADTWFLTRLMAQLKQEIPGSRLLVCPPFYWGPGGQGWWVYGEDRVAYLKMVGAEWPKEIEVFWTGMAVNGDALAKKEHVKWISDLIQRKPYFWQNSEAYKRHLHRRHHPTDWVTLSWAYWDGFMEGIGWYGFNGSDLARYGLTETLAADFQWNPQAYCEDGRNSARRSVIETADKFVGANAWSNMCKVTIPLAAFDPYFPDSDAGDAAEALALKEAAKNCDLLEAKRNEIYSAFKDIKEMYPASLKAWTSLEGFIGVANMVDKLKTDPKFAFYRAAVQQREEAKAKGLYDQDKDQFLAAADFVGGFLQEVSVDALDGKKLQVAQAIGGPKRDVKAVIKLPKGQEAGVYELIIKGRQNETAGQMTLALNGKTFFEKPAPFGRQESSLVHISIPSGLVLTNINTFTINLAEEGKKQETGGDAETMGSDVCPPLAIYYAVFKKLTDTQGKQ